MFLLLLLKLYIKSLNAECKTIQFLLSYLPLCLLHFTFPHFTFFFPSSCPYILSFTSSLFLSCQPLAVPVFCPFWHIPRQQWRRVWGGGGFCTGSVWVQVHQCLVCVDSCVCVYVHACIGTCPLHGPCRASCSVTTGAVQIHQSENSSCLLIDGWVFG